MAITPEEQSVPATLISEDGQVVGDVSAYHVDPTGLPVFAQVERPTSAQIIVPVLKAQFDHGKLSVPYMYDHILDAPRAAVGHLSVHVLDKAIEFYGLDEVETSEPPKPVPPPPLQPPGPAPSEPDSRGTVHVPRRPLPQIIPAFLIVNRDTEG